MVAIGFSGCQDEAPDLASPKAYSSVKCSDLEMRSFIPDLILPPEVVPTETQRDRLCSCVLVRLDPSDVDALERLNPNGRTWARQDSVPDNLMASLREAVTRCGGEVRTLSRTLFFTLHEHHSRKMFRCRTLQESESRSLVRR